MERNPNQRPLDAADAQILRTLQANGRTTWSSLAESIGMSAPSATERVRRLEANGYLTGFRAELSADVLGYPTLGFVAVSIRDTGHHEPLLEQVREIPEVQECHVVAGEYDYLLKVRCRSPQDLAQLLRERVRSLPGIERTNTVMVLQTVKETHDLPVPEVEEEVG